MSSKVAKKQDVAPRKIYLTSNGFYINKGFGDSTEDQAHFLHPTHGFIK